MLIAYNPNKLEVVITCVMNYTGTRGFLTYDGVKAHVIKMSVYLNACVS